MHFLVVNINSTVNARINVNFQFEIVAYRSVTSICELKKDL